MKTWLIVAFSVFLAGCGGDQGSCLNALGDRYTHLSFDHTRSDLERKGDEMSGLVVVRRKGTRDYQVKNATCHFNGNRVRSANCPGCPPR